MEESGLVNNSLILAGPASSSGSYEETRFHPLCVEGIAAPFQLGGLAYL